MRKSMTDKGVPVLRCAKGYAVSAPDAIAKSLNDRGIKTARGG
jgi:hypothetical protein